MTQQWKLVPVEPTKEQVKACSHDDHGGLVTAWYRRAIYAAMIAAAPTPPASAQDDAKDDILRWILREAEAAKEPCGDNPESATAVRNAKLAAISGAAAQALGLVRGPNYAAPAAGDARAPNLDIEAAAKTLAECMDYPWVHMPEQGRAAMREHAQTVIRAASQQQEG